jgi:hypothetical protein
MRDVRLREIALDTLSNAHRTIVECLKNDSILIADDLVKPVSFEAVLELIAKAT